VITIPDKDTKQNIDSASVLPAGLYTAELVDFRLERSSELEIVWLLKILQGAAGGNSGDRLVQYSYTAAEDSEKTAANFKVLNLDENNLVFALSNKAVLRGRKLLLRVSDNADISFIRDVSPAPLLVEIASSAPF
jgi:hypothetical protein